MNLDTFRSRVAAATTAARQFSSLDEMAQADEYVQSEGLRVSNKKRDRGEQQKHGLDTTGQQQLQGAVENLSDKFVEALSAAAKPKPRYRNNEAAPSNRGDANKNPTPSKHAAPEHNSPQASGVILVDNRHAHILHQLRYDSDNDSSDDERGGNTQSDVEFSRKNSLSAELERELNETLQNHRSGGEEITKSKDPHRFMIMTADLEERESLLQSQSTPVNQPIAKTEVNRNISVLPPATSAGQETSNALKAGFSWVKNVASPQLQALSNQIMTKVAENEHRFSTSLKGEQQSVKPMIGPRHVKVTKTNDEEDKIIMTSSATFLADEDHAELARIRNKHSSSQMSALLRTCLEGLWENPRLAFVAATLIFALLVYYYSRKRSVDDVL
jgi:hypothetical protein